MEHNPNEVHEKQAAHTQKAIQPSEHKPIEKVEHSEAKIQEVNHSPKNETVQKVVVPEQKEENQEENIRKFVFELQPHITEEEITKYIHYQQLQKRPLTKENFEEWQRTHTKKEQAVMQEPKKVSEHKIQPPKAQTPQQVCDQFFSTHKQGQNNEVKVKIITLLNTLVHTSLPINSSHVANYFKSEQPSYSLAHFKEWIVVQQAKQIDSYVKHYRQTKNYSQLQNTFKKITEILAKTNSQKSSLQINLGLGQNKGKSNIKCGLSLTNSKNNNMEISLQVKIKKKIQLKTLLQGQIKKWQKQQSFNLFKLCNIDITQTDKGLKIVIHSQIFSKEICKEIIESVNGLYQNEEKPVLNVQGELTIKNSVRSDETNLQKKRFMKWLCQGFTGHLTIEGSSGVIQHFTSPLAEFFPIFKVIRSGQINLKTKNIPSVDKLFDKLGINQISEQTPTLHAFFAEILKEQLGHEGLPWLPQIIKKCIHFASTIPNERISIDVSGHLSHLHFQLSIASEACKELGDIVLSLTNEIFS